MASGARSILSHAIATQVEQARALEAQRQAPESVDVVDQGQPASAEAQRLKFLPGERPSVNGFWLGWVAGPPAAR